MTAEPMNRAEDAKEDFLREVERFVAVAQQVHRQLHDHALVFRHQLGTRRLIAFGAPLHERGFAIADFGPSDYTRVLHGEFPKGLRNEVGNSYHYTPVRPRPAVQVPRSRG